MKNSTPIMVILIALSSVQLFSQERYKLEFNNFNFLPQGAVNRYIDHKQFEFLSDSNILIDEKLRSKVNKTILDDGFLLVEVIRQKWVGNTWVNDTKHIPITGIEQFDDVVNTYSLSQNYPNPFNPTTTIRYEISERSFVTLKVYDVLGNVVETLVKEEKPAGEYNVEFRIDNLELTSGVYFYQLLAGDFVNTKKMVLLR